MKTFTLIFVLLTSLTFDIHAQITIRNDDIKEKPVYKPVSFDSLSNLTWQNRAINYKKYIGYKVFFLPRSSKFEDPYNNTPKIIKYLYTEDSVEILKSGKIPFESTFLSKSGYGDSKNMTGDLLERYNQEKGKYDQSIDKVMTNIYLPHFYHQKTEMMDGKIIGDIGTPPENLEGKYFTILDIKLRKGVYGAEVPLEDFDESYRVSAHVSLLNDSGNDTLYWAVEGGDFEKYPFFLVPYFEKQKELYLDKTLIAITEISNLVDINTGAVLKISPDEKWLCYDVTFTNSKESEFIKPFYYLRKDDKEIALEFGYFDKEKLITEAEFNRREEEKKKKEEERIRERQEEEKRIALAKAERRKYCIATYGSGMGEIIAGGNVVLGMNKEMCRASWGTPIRVYTTAIRGHQMETWVYGWATYLYFDNGVLTAIHK